MKLFRKGDMGLILQIILWGAVIIIAFFLIRQYIVGAGTVIPGEGMITP